MRLAPLLRPASLVALAAALPACGLLGGGGPKLKPEERFGYRPPAQTSEEADIWAVSPRTPGVAYFTFDVPVTEIVPRVEPRTTAPGDSARVELLIKGGVPNACYELDSVSQERLLQYVTVTLKMRRPQGVPCQTVVRRYHVYLTLDGRFPPGPYVFAANGTQRPYELRPRPLPDTARVARGGGR